MRFYRNARMLKMKKADVPNPAGKAGKPIIVPQMNLDDALKKILSASPVPKEAKPAKKKPVSKKLKSS